MPVKKKSSYCIMKKTRFFLQMPIFPSSILSSHSAEQSHERCLKFYWELEKAGSGAAIAFLGVCIVRVCHIFLDFKVSTYIEIYSF